MRVATLGGIVLALACLCSAQDLLQDPDAWTIDGQEGVSLYTGGATLFNPYDFTLDPTSCLAESRITRTITVPANAELQMSLTMEVMTGGIPETDTFCLEIADGQAEPVTLFSLDSNEAMASSSNPFYVLYTVDITEDLSGWTGQDVDLSLVLKHECFDGVTTSVTIGTLSIVGSEPQYAAIDLLPTEPFSTAGAETAEVLLVAQTVDADTAHVDVDGASIMYTATSATGDVVASTTTGTQSGYAEAVFDLPVGVYTVTSEDTSGHTDTGLVVVYDPTEQGFVTGGGYISTDMGADGCKRANFGFNAKYKNGLPTGHLEFRFSDGTIDLKSETIDYLVIVPDSPYACFAGWARAAHDGPGYWFCASLEDNSKSGKGDAFTIEIWTPTDLDAPSPSITAGSLLEGGNIVIHKK